MLLYTDGSESGRNGLRESLDRAQPRWFDFDSAEANWSKFRTCLPYYRALLQHRQKRLPGSCAVNPGYSEAQRVAKQGGAHAVWRLFTRLQKMFDSFQAAGHQHYRIHLPAVEEFPARARRDLQRL